MTKIIVFSKKKFLHFLPAGRTKACAALVSESQVQFYMVNSEFLSKMYCVLANFGYKLRNEIGHFSSDVPTSNIISYIGMTDETIFCRGRFLKKHFVVFFQNRIMNFLNDFSWKKIKTIFFLHSK